MVHEEERMMKVRSRSVRILLFASLLLIARDVASSQTEPISGLESYVQKAMKEWGAPGLAIAIVRNDSTVFMKGYGVRKIGEDSPVTPQTIFAIASTTKAMTVACLGMLVDEGKLKWDDLVTKYLPWFQMYDPYVTRELTVRDLLAHRSGLAAADELWDISPFSRDEMLRRVRLIRPASSFRSRYEYQNLMYIAAGEIIPTITGMSWDDFIAQRLFKPLGMKRSSTSVTALEGESDIASPHYKIDGTWQPVPWVNCDNIGGAGSVNSCASDMAAWIRLNLAGGVYDGNRILSANTMREIQSPQTIIGIDSVVAALRPSTHFRTYGLGWRLDDYLGRKIVFHTGSINNMRTRVVLIPEEQTGFVIFHNSRDESLHESIGYWILDRILNGPSRDWSAELLKSAKESEEKKKTNEKKRNDERLQNTKPSLALDAYVGKYENELYGPATVRLEEGRLILNFYPSYEGTMEHWHFDTFDVEWKDRTLGRNTVVFTLGADGNVDGFQWVGFAEFRKMR